MINGFVDSGNEGPGVYVVGYDRNGDLIPGELHELGMATLDANMTKAGTWVVLGGVVAIVLARLLVAASPRIRCQVTFGTW